MSDHPGIKRQGMMPARHLDPYNPKSQDAAPVGNRGNRNSQSLADYVGCPAYIQGQDEYHPLPSMTTKGQMALTCYYLLLK